MIETNFRSLALLAVAFCFPAIANATYQTITIDGDTSDWAGVPAVDSDPVDNAGSTDFAETFIANDDDYLYIRNTYHGTTSTSSFISLDVDGDTSTGFDVFSLGLIGGEAAWQNDFPFTQSTGVFNDGGGMSGDFFGSGAALLSTLPSGERELAISLDILFNVGGGAVFPDDTLNLLLWTDAAAGDVSTPISYTLSTVPEPNGFTGLLLAGMLAAWLKRRIV